jgi:ribosomal protein S18 acetylase RimI-like enzyme
MSSAEPPPLTRSNAGARIESWTPQQFSRRLDEAMAIYAAAMRYPSNTAAQRGISARKHTGIDGFACRAAVDESGALLGFGYGYTSKPGQWWHDLARRALTRETAQSWLTDAFELSEFHVLPEYQGMGIGRELIVCLADGIPHRAMVLSTPDADTRAFRLYRDLGFEDLARNYLFPGDARPFAVLGARLPLHGH